MVELLYLLGLLAAGVAHARRPVDQQARVGQRTKIVEIELFRVEQRQFVRLEQVRSENLQDIRVGQHALIDLFELEHRPALVERRIERLPRGAGHFRRRCAQFAEDLAITPIELGSQPRP